MLLYFEDTIAFVSTHKASQIMAKGFIRFAVVRIYCNTTKSTHIAIPIKTLSFLDYDIKRDILCFIFLHDYSHSIIRVKFT